MARSRGARSSPWWALAIGVSVVACMATPPAPAVVAPQPVAYTCDQLKKLAAEHLALPPDSMLAQAMDDYRLERKELRALHGLPEPAPCPKA